MQDASSSFLTITFYILEMILLFWAIPLLDTSGKKPLIQKDARTPVFIQFSSVAQSCPTLCDPRNQTARQASLSITNSWSLPKLMSIELMMPSNHLILCHPLLLLPSIFPNIRVFSNESALHIRWPNVFIAALFIIAKIRKQSKCTLTIEWIKMGLCMLVTHLCLCLTLCDPMDCSPPGCCVLGIL